MIQFTEKQLLTLRKSYHEDAARVERDSLPHWFPETIEPFLQNPLSKEGEYFSKNLRDFIANNARWAALLFRYSVCNYLSTNTPKAKHQFVIDVGACVGEFTFNPHGCTDPSTQLLAFEPNPSNRRIIQERLATSDYIPQSIARPVQLPTSQVKLLPQALSDKKDSLLLMIPQGHEWARSRGARLVKGALLPTQKSISVEVDCLDTILSTYGPPEEMNINYIKIDAEGYDFNVIKGIREYMQSVQFFHFEVNAMIYPDHNHYRIDDSLKNIIEYIDLHGFNTYHFGHKRALQLNGEKWDDVFKTLPCLANTDLFCIPKHNPLMSDLVGSDGEYLLLNQL